MAVALSLKEQKSDVVNQAIRELQNGRNNATGQFTLNANATTTIVTPGFATPQNGGQGVYNCSPSCYVFLTPLTQHAANDMATTSVVAGSSQFTVTHANNPRTDRTFGYVVLGGN